MNKKMLLLTLAIPVILSQNVQAQTSSRLIAQSQWLSNGATLIPNDSTDYNYSSGRGGDLAHQLKYDNSTNFNFSGDTAYVNNTYSLQSFDANNNLLSTITQYWNGSGFVNVSKTIYTYNVNNTLATKIQQYWGGTSWVNISQDVYSYNSANQLFSDQNNNWNSVSDTFTPNMQSIYYYNIAGNLVQQVDQSYDASTLTYNYSDQYLYTYSGSEQLTATYSTWNGAAWVNDYVYTNTYDSSGDELTSLYQTYSGLALVNQTMQTYSNFTATGSNLPQTQISQVYNNAGTGSFQPVTQYTNTYNTYGQLTQSVAESYNPGVGWEFASGDPTNYYYYQTYSPSSTAVKNVVNNSGTANIYPVPAQNTLHIDLNWTEAQSATISIFDMSGRQLNTVDAPTGTQFHGTLSVNNLADGMYVVRIDGTQGQIVKQIVVAH